MLDHPSTNRILLDGSPELCWIVFGKNKTRTDHRGQVIKAQILKVCQCHFFDRKSEICLRKLNSNRLRFALPKTKVTKSGWYRSSFVTMEWGCIRCKTRGRSFFRERLSQLNVVTLIVLISTGYNDLRENTISRSKNKAREPAIVDKETQINWFKRQ